MVAKRYMKSAPMPKRMQKLMKTREASNSDMVDETEGVLF